MTMATNFPLSAALFAAALACDVDGTPTQRDQQ